MIVIGKITYDTGLKTSLLFNYHGEYKRLPFHLFFFQEDTRKCLLCGLTKDAEPSGAGRLLCCGLDEWVHVNCGLWSAEVFEDDEGRLQNVQVALSRGKHMV